VLSTLESYAAAVVLAAGLGVVAERLNQPTVVAYVVTGLLAGPAVLDLAGATSLTDGLGELGLVFLLFVLGLEVDIADMRRLLKPMFVGATAHMLLVGAVGFGLATVLGFGGTEALVIGLAVMFGSTAVAVKLMSDNDMLASLPGRLGVGLLLVEDLAVVVVLAVVSAGISLSSLGVGIGRAVLFSALVAGVSLVLSRYMPRVLGSTEAAGQRFVVYSSAWVLGFALLSEIAGIPAELGAFFAGVSLSGFPGSSEVTERVRPLSELLLAVFFVNVGLGVTAGQLRSQAVAAVLFSLVIVGVKLVSWLGVLKLLDFSAETSFKTGVSLSQVSEFALVLGAVAASDPVDLIGGEVVAFLTVSAGLTMAGLSYAIVGVDRLFEPARPLLDRLSWSSRDSVSETLEDHAVVVGFDEFSRPAIGFLEQRFEQVVVVDNEFRDMEDLSSQDYEYVFGDLQHGEIREAVRLEEAEFVFCNVEDEALAERVVEESPRSTTVFVTAQDMVSASELYDLGADFAPVINFLSAERLTDYLRVVGTGQQNEDREKLNARLEVMGR
jgi:Kef-type K+ transport system membrane component KefB